MNANMSADYARLEWEFRRDVDNAVESEESKSMLIERRMRIRFNYEFISIRL